MATIILENREGEETEMNTEIGYGPEAAQTMGAINEITNTARMRIETAVDISQRLENLRRRLIGESEHDLNKGVAPDAPAPERSEVEELSEQMDVLRIVLEKTLNDLAKLETL
jgi:hypothetical protein